MSQEHLLISSSEITTTSDFRGGGLIWSCSMMMSTWTMAKDLSITKSVLSHRMSTINIFLYALVSVIEINKVLIWSPIISDNIPLHSIVSLIFALISSHHPQYRLYTGKHGCTTLLCFSPSLHACDDEIHYPEHNLSVVTHLCCCARTVFTCRDTRKHCYYKRHM